MVCYGYLRVSTVKQEETNYKASILNLANEKELGKVTWISETVSGRKDWRNRLLGKEFEQMKEGDTIILAEFSRIGRDFFNSMMFVDECRKKKIHIISVNGDIPQTNDANSNLLLSVTAWKAQMERENIAARTKIGIAAAKARGVKLGRKTGMILDKDPDNVNKIKEMIDNGVKLGFIAKKFECTRATLWKFIKNHHIGDEQ